MLDLTKLRLCFIAGTLGMGGAERQLFYILKVLRQQGATVNVLCLTRGEFWEERIRGLGIGVIWVGQSESRLSRLGKIVRTLRRMQLDILQSQHFFTNLYSVAAARMLGIRGIGGMRSDCISEVHANGRLLGRLSLHAPRAIAANSLTAINNAVKMGVPPSRLHFLPNVVDTDQFRPSAKANGPVRLIWAGRLSEEKRLDRFLKMLAHLRRQSPTEFSAVIVGDGPQRPLLEQQAMDLGLLPDVVEFRGQVAEMAPVYQEGNILVLTSEREGTPNVALEAMASGLPVVATAVGGVSEIVRHGHTGYAVDDKDEELIVHHLSRLINDPVLRARMGSRARSYVEEHHSPRGVYEALTSLYEAVLS